MAPQFVYVMKGLGKIYPPDSKVLNDIWLSFLPGAKIGVLGLNGAGKSTLLKMVAGAVTLGTMQQIIRAFGKVQESFQYLVTSWSTIVELISVYKRLRAFEAQIGMLEITEASAAGGAGTA